MSFDHEWVQTLALLSGGLWAYLHFIWKRERFPRITMRTEFSLHGEHEGALLASVRVLLRNEGSVRLRFRRGWISVRTLNEKDPLQEGGGRLQGRVVFPNTLVKRRSLFPDAWEYSFVDAGCENSYPTTIRIPKEARFLLVKAKFFYEEEESDFHSDERVIPLPSSSGSSISPAC